MQLKVKQIEAHILFLPTQGEIKVRYTWYSLRVNPLQWNRSSETTAMSMMRDQMSWKTRYSWQKVLHSSYWTWRKDHLLEKTTLLLPMGWSFKTGSTVQQNLLIYIYTDGEDWIYLQYYKHQAIIIRIVG